MTDLVDVGPAVLSLRWGDRREGPDGEVIRDFYPARRYQEPRGYLHGGTAAAALVAAARISTAPQDELTSVSVRLHRLTPLGTDLRAAVTTNGGSIEARLEHVRPADATADPIEMTAIGTLRFEGREPAPDVADIRQLAAVPIPEPAEHDLFATCYVCGQDNPAGLGLLPGWHVEDRVVTAFVPDERYVEDGRKGVVSPLAVCALLSCPTLWACRAQMTAAGHDAALLASYEVRFHGHLRVPKNVRTVGFAGTPDRDTFRAASALVDEDGGVHATAYAIWSAVEEVPARDPEGAPPLWSETPEKGGRPEAYSPDAWGTPLPGRREGPGPRSQRPGH
jgi:hypothetical protein